MGRKPKNAQPGPARLDEQDSDEDVADNIPGASERRSHRGGPRLTAAQRAEIVSALTRGESGRALAERFGVSLGAIYSYRRKMGTAPTQDSPARPESELRARLVAFAVRTLLGQAIDDAERSELETRVREELMKRLAEGL
jgi:hypothetical protein